MEKIIKHVGVNHKDNIGLILCSLDGTGESVITSTLSSGNIIIRDAIKDLIHNIQASINPYTAISAEELETLDTLLARPQFSDFSPEDCMNWFIRPLYTYEAIGSIEQNIQLVGDC